MGKGLALVFSLFLQIIILSSEAICCKLHTADEETEAKESGDMFIWYLIDSPSRPLRSLASREPYDFLLFHLMPPAFHKSLTVYLTAPIRWPFPFFSGSEPSAQIAPTSPHHICHPPASRLFLFCFVPYFAPSESSACHCLPPLSPSIITFELRSGTFLDFTGLVLSWVSIVSILGIFSWVWCQSLSGVSHLFALHFLTSQKRQPVPRPWDLYI